MKIIINESQLRLIVENEDKDGNLLDFTPFVDVNPIKWDEMFERLNKKKGGKYDGYYIDGFVDLYKSDVTELKYLVRVEGWLDLRDTFIESLPMLSYVGGYFFLTNTPIESLPKLEHVGAWLELFKSKIDSLPMLKYVGGYLDLRHTPLSKVITKEELRKQIYVEGVINL